MRRWTARILVIAVLLHPALAGQWWIVALALLLLLILDWALDDRPGE